MLGTDLVVEVRPVERRLEDRHVGHAQVLLDVHLHLGRRGGRQGDQRRLPDLVDDRADAAVLRTEVVTPLRDAVGLVDGIERDLDLAQEGHVVLLGERLGREIEQLGLALHDIRAYLRHGRLVERRIEEVGDARLGREGTHGIDLILHQGDQRRDDDRDPVHEQRRQLVAQRLAAARRHQHERILTLQYVADHRLLIPFERRKAEVLLQLVVQQGRIVLFHLSVFALLLHKIQCKDKKLFGKKHNFVENYLKETQCVCTRANSSKNTRPAPS